jgi:hypothetical protein
MRLNNVKLVFTGGDREGDRSVRGENGRRVVTNISTLKRATTNHPEIRFILSASLSSV